MRPGRGRAHNKDVVRPVWLLLAALVPAGAVAAANFPPPSSQGLASAKGYSWLCGAGSRDSICADAVPSKLRRPLRIPTVAPGTTCPRSRAGRVSSAFGIALGAGPAYPVPFRDGVLHYDRGRTEGGWIYVKVLWIVRPSYRGPVLIRGRQLDGTHWLGFASGPRPLSELQLPPPRSSARGDWRGIPSYTRVRGSGCYAYQVDGSTFSRVLTFEIAQNTAKVAVTRR